MRDYKSPNHLMKGFQLTLSSDFKIAIAVAVTVTIINVFILAYRVGYVSGKEHSNFLNGAYITGDNFFHTLNNIRLFITIALLVATLGLWLRRTKGLFLSLAALILIFLTYAWWYLDTKAYLRNAEVTEHTMQTNAFYKEMGLLHGATHWDWVVLIIAIVLFSWVIKTLIGTLVSPRVQPRNF